MNSDVSTIARRVRGQADALPDLFGRFDFDKAPERWAPEADAVSELGRVRSLDRSDYLDDPDLLARIREYTMLCARHAFSSIVERFGLQPVEGGGHGPGGRAGVEGMVGHAHRKFPERHH